MRLPLALLVVSTAVLSASPALAVTNGAPDGNAHPNVGALVADLPGAGPTVLCSGTLVAPTLFLTAGHCTAGLDGPVSVTFQSALAPGALTLVPGIAQTEPGFGHDRADPRDLGVVVLAYPPPGITPAQLAPANAAADLGGATVTNVGYGYYDRETGGGPPQFLYDGLRRTSASTVRSVTPALVRTTDGVCFGDSGGPRFDGSLLVAVTSSGDSACAGMSTGYRVDTPSALSFVGSFFR